MQTILTIKRREVQTFKLQNALIPFVFGVFGVLICDSLPEKNMIQRWFLAIAVGIIMAIFAVYPQINLKSLRGADFQGVFASCDLDEMAYTSYLQAIIDGRPRKNDPYTGRDDSAETPLPESLFSIQFFPAYLSAIPARILGLSASQMMPIISVFSGFFTALALFWLIVSITEDELLAAVGTLIVIAGSALIIGVGAINGFYEGGVAYPFFPFMRRYIPSSIFPFMFAFFACLWNGLKTEDKKKRIIYSVAASLCFSALVFSYFYVWTSAAAVLFGLTLFLFVFRAENWRKDAEFILITDIFCVLALIPYALLLANRDETMDQAQLLVLTRQPDLWRNVEIIGYAVLAIAVIYLLTKITKLAEKKFHFIAAFAFAPFLVMNQQVLSGRSLQPFHYEFYVINYVVLLSAVLLVTILWQKYLSAIKFLSLGSALILGLSSIVWSYIEARDTTAFWDSTNVRRDEAMPVNLRLKELAANDIEKAKHLTTLNLESLQADGQTTVAPFPTVWARHQHVFAGLHSWDENKQRYYQLLYYSDLDEQWLKNALTGCTDIEACMALFGWDRFNARLSANARPLTQIEIDEEVRRFAEFGDKFSLKEAANPQISFLVISNEYETSLKNFDRWYERDNGEVLGKYVLYKVNLKQFQ